LPKTNCSSSVTTNKYKQFHGNVTLANDAMISTRSLSSVTPENLAEVHFVARSLDGLTDATAIVIEDD